jgi:hypothetical protein
MTISAVAYVANDGGTSVTSGNVDVGAGDLLVPLAHCDTSTDSTAAVFTFSDNQTPDLTFTNISQRDGSDGDGGGVVARYHIATGAISGYNMTCAVNGVGAANDSPAIKIVKFQAADFDAADVVGALTENNLTTDPQNTASITAETSGTGICAWTDWNQTGTPTSSDLTMSGFNTTGDISGGSGYKALTAAAGATANINSGAAPSGNYLWFEIRAGAGGGGATQPPRSMHQYRMRNAA